jgi:hypothetical protein
LEEVVNKTGDAQAKSVLESLKTHALLGLPIREGVFNLGDVNADEWFHFIPLTVADGKYDLWRPLVGFQNAAAHFIAEKRALVVKDTVEMSRLRLPKAFLKIACGCIVKVYLCVLV